MAANQPQDRAKALSLALAQIDKNFGKGSVMRLGDDTRPPVAVIPTGSVALDVALGVGGLPRGRVVEIYGRNLPVRLLWLCTRLLTPKKLAVTPPLSTPSTP